MKKETIAQIVPQATSPQGQGPAPTGVWVIVLGFCRIPGTCFPVDERSWHIDPTANANDLIAQISHGFYTYWINAADPLAPALREAYRQKWLSDTRKP